MLVVSLALVGCATTTHFGPAGTLDAGFCMHDAPKSLGWLSCDKPLINFEADVLSNDEEATKVDLLGRTHITPTPAELSGHYLYGEGEPFRWATQNNSVPTVPSYAVPLLDRFSHTQESDCINSWCWEAVAEELRPGGYILH